MSRATPISTSLAGRSAPMIHIQWSTTDYVRWPDCSADAPRRARSAELALRSTTALAVTSVVSTYYLLS
jgi:hypothetical protein